MKFGVKVWVSYFEHKKGQVVLYPKHIRFRKYQKGRFKGCKTNGTQLCFGKYGMKSCKVGHISYQAIEVVCCVLSRKF
jgi:large subunit ribosomal protein L16